MDAHSFSCKPDENATFSPPAAADLSKYNIVIAYPLCGVFVRKGGKIAIDRDGGLTLGDSHYPSGDFCVDTFLENGLRKQEVLSCHRPSKWIRVRTYLFPACKVISLIFLSITIACHLFVPRLLAHGGLYLMCYAVSLFTAFSTGFSVNVFHEHLGDSSCVNLAIAMQFGFIATFFWLNVMCFETWRKIRGLAYQKRSRPFPSGIYVLYGWGAPSCICTITIVMQHLAPDNVWGVIKPYIGISRCWFREDIGLLLYFYGPISFAATCSSVFIVLTFINYKTILRNFMTMSGPQRERDREVEPDKKARPPKLPPVQITGPIQDFSTKMKLFSLMVFCWITEILSWKIPPMELWALTDTLNSLQGLFIFIIFLLNRHKRALVEEKFPLPFNLARRCQKLMGKAAPNQSKGSSESIPHEKDNNSTVSSVSMDLPKTTATS
ncbi:G-protein coupled receptor Mth2-like [Macrobrachium nipponense]|uniref:G-protein coupled receptor Mth2-like n=1 Tax=Macrobrachium nipponense TaxID=159736 RepID=UPI0030C8958D